MALIKKELLEGGTDEVLLRKKKYDAKYRGGVKYHDEGFLIPNFCIRERSVLAFNCKRSAALLAPEILQLVSVSTRRR